MDLFARGLLPRSVLSRLSLSFWSLAAVASCVTEPGAPTESEDDDDSTVKEVLSFSLAPASVGVSANVDTVDSDLVFGGMASADVDRDGTDDLLVLGGRQPSKLLLNSGNGTFDEFPDPPELDEYAIGPLFADIDGDHFADLLVPSAHSGAIDVFHNDEGVAFERVEDAGFGVEFANGRGAVAADVDSDGDLDVFVLRASSAMEGVLWLNDGQGRFSDVSAAFESSPAVGGALAAVFVDADEDGRIDLLLTRDRNVSLWLNQTTQSGQLRFVETDLREAVTTLRELRTSDGAFMVNIADMDNDTDYDVLLSGVGAVDVEGAGKDGAPVSVDEALASLDGGPEDGGPADSGAESDAALGTAPALDDAGPASVTDSGSADSGIGDAGPAGEDTGSAPEQTRAFSVTAGGRNMLLANQGTQFTDWHQNRPLSDTGAVMSCIADFNNDAMLDVFQATAPAEAVDNASSAAGTAGMGLTAHLYLQSRNHPGTFSQLAGPAGLAEAGEGRSLLCFDYDADGDVDILIAPFEGPVRLFRNDLDPALGPANYISVRVRGSEEFPNVLGAVVSVVVAGETRMRVIGQDRVSGSQAPDALHIGLGSSTAVDGLFIAWPDGAEETLIEDLAVNTAYTVTRK